AELHILNCYYKTTVSGSLAIGLGGGTNGTTCYVENTNFATIGTIYKSYIYKSDGVTIEDGGTVGVKFDNCTKGTTPTAVTGLDAGTAPAKPTYTYAVMPV